MLKALFVLLYLTFSLDCCDHVGKGLHKKTVISELVTCEFELAAHGGCKLAILNFNSCFSFNLSTRN